ncbi:MAG TPA: hypothetical protein VIG53_05425 [Actinomycetota bacterium]
MVATILAVVLGGYVVAAALSEPTGPPIGIPGVVGVRPLSGWVARTTVSFDGAPSLQLTRGNGNLIVSVRQPYRGDPQTLAETYRAFLSDRLSQLSVSSTLEPVRLRSGQTGVRFAYIGVLGDSGTSVEGEVTVFVTPSGHGIVFNGWAPAGLLPFVRSDVRTMIAEAEVT